MLKPFTSLSRQYKHVRVSVRQGNIVEERGVEAIVNAANAELKPGSGVCGAIFRAAGQ